MRDSFYVNFRSFDSENCCEIARFDSFEEAITFALALHRSSNVLHHIAVLDLNRHERLILNLSDDAQR